MNRFAALLLQLFVVLRMCHFPFSLSVRIILECVDIVGGKLDAGMANPIFPRIQRRYSRVILNTLK